MQRYNGNNVDEDLAPSEDDDNTSLDNDFQLSELCQLQNNTHCALNDDTLRLQQQLEIHSPAKVRLPSETQVRQSMKNMLECIDYVIFTETLVTTPQLLKFGRN